MRNSERLLQLVGDLLSTAMAKTTVTPQPTGIVELIAATIGSASLSAQDNGVHLFVGLHKFIPAFPDPLWMGPVLDNLLSNAIKYSPIGGQVSIRAFITTEHMMVEIADTGIRMTPKEQQAVFTKRFLSSDAFKAAIPGAGVGLAITKTIVEDHQGSIDLVGEAGRGSTFTARLPASA